MRWRIVVATMAIAALSIVLFGVPLALLVERFVDQDATLRLQRQAILAARDVPSDFSSTRDPVELPAGSDGASLALYDQGGRIIAGDGPPRADVVTNRALENRVSDADTSTSRIVAVPVTSNERVVGAIRAEQETAASDARTWRIVGALAALAGAVLAVATLVSLVVARRLARPVRTLVDATVALGAGDFSVNVPVSGIPEIDAAGQALGATATRIEDAMRRERAFSADASHQLRTPLTGMRAGIETELQFPRADSTLALREALEDVERLDRTIDELLSVARSHQLPAQSVDLAAVLSTLREMWHGRFAALGRQLRIDIDDELPPIIGNAVMLRHALDVLVDNALVHGGGTVRIVTRTTHSTVTVSVTDEGSGFDRGTSTEGADSQHGFGLDLAERLLTTMSARLVVVRRDARPRIDVVMTRTEAPA